MYVAQFCIALKYAFHLWQTTGKIFSIPAVAPCKTGESMIFGTEMPSSHYCKKELFSPIPSTWVSSCLLMEFQFSNPPLAAYGTSTYPLLTFLRIFVTVVLRRSFVVSGLGQKTITQGSYATSDEYADVLVQFRYNNAHTSWHQDHSS